MKYLLLATALLLSQAATAADLSPRYARHRFHHHERTAERSRVITCTTSSFALFSYSDCGQGLDPLAFAGN